MFPRNSWLLEKFPEVIIFGIKLEKMSDKLPERLGDACWLGFHNFDIVTFGRLDKVMHVCMLFPLVAVCKISDKIADKGPNFECLNIS